MKYYIYLIIMHYTWQAGAKQNVPDSIEKEQIMHSAEKTAVNIKQANGHIF